MLLLRHCHADDFFFFGLSLLRIPIDTNFYSRDMQSNRVVFAGVTSYRGELMTHCLERPIEESSHRHFVTCRLHHFYADEGLDRRRSFRVSLKPEQYPFAATWKCQETVVLFPNDVRIDHVFQTQSRYPCQLSRFNHCSLVEPSNQRWAF